MDHSFQNYFYTGELARMFHLNKQTLFYYDKEGLLHPQYRNPENGYRMYQFNQIYHLALICYLRKIGFSIEQIKDYLKGDSALSNIHRLQQRSEEIRKNYQEILRLDNIIQRKLLFVQRKLDKLTIGEAQITNYPRRAYLPLGLEISLYNKDIFYCYPTIAFYQYNEADDHYKITFGAYLNSTENLDEEYMEKIQYIPQQKVLSYEWKGSFSKIEQKVRELHKKYSYLSLSKNSYNFNIIDQFLEKDPDHYITEIQIPILDPDATFSTP